MDSSTTSLQQMKAKREREREEEGMDIVKKVISTNELICIKKIGNHEQSARETKFSGLAVLCCPGPLAPWSSGSLLVWSPVPFDFQHHIANRWLQV